MKNIFKAKTLYAVLICLKHCLTKRDDRLRVMRQGAKEKFWS